LVNEDIKEEIKCIKRIIWQLPEKHSSYFLAQPLKPATSPHKLKIPTGHMSEYPAYFSEEQAKVLQRQNKLETPRCPH
jgi:hypothetical protein